MTRTEYERICQAAFHGENRKVENQPLHEEGEVFNCEANTFNVRVQGEVRQWSRQVCEEPGEGD